MTTTLSATTKTSASGSRPFQTVPGDHRFFSVMSIVAAITIAAGFSQTYVPKVLAGAPAVPGIIHFHALVFTSWLVVFVLNYKYTA